MDAKLNHSDLSALLAKAADISGAKAELFTKAMFDIIIEGLEKDGLVKINGLFLFCAPPITKIKSITR
jgi:nucleoid DNA-binding protein